MSDTKTKPLWLSEEERAVLSSVQASVQEQDDYEGSVLRRATHSLAPTLIPPNFPDVTSLLGGGGGGAGVTNGPVWHSILARTRRTLREWRLRNGRADPEPDRGQADMWHMKEQILWHVLSQTPTTARASVEAAADDDNSYYHERAAEQARSQRLIQPHDDKKQQQHSKHNGGLTIDSAAPTSVRNGFQQGGDDVDTSSTATNSGQQPARRRVPMMKRKRIHRDDNDDDNDGSQKNRLNPQEKEALKQQRTERNRIKHERRRRCHRNNTMPLTDSDGSSDEEMQLDDNSKDDDISKDDDNSKDEEMNDIQPDESNRLGPEDGLQNATTSIHRQDVSEETSDDRVATVQEESVSLVDVKPMVALLAKAATTAVTCPLCQQSIPVPVESDMDAVLSHHMSLCGCDDQTQHQRRSTRSRSTRAVPSYAEPTDEEDPSSEQQQHQRVRAASLRSSVKADFTTMGTRTTSRSRASKVSSVLNGHKAESVRTSTKNDHSKAPVDTAVYPAALDDMNEWAYEDRVDDWLEHGLSRMKKMKERDELESVPGAEEYDGGLLVPAWMNDRLFTYQREGLKWMWDLHQQQAGGIIGDEMGLGKTVQVAAFLGAAAASRKLKSVLIVAPATILQHWLTELALWAPGLRRVLIHSSGGEVDGLTRSISTQLLRKLANWVQQVRANRLNEPIDDADWDTFEPHTFCGTGYAIVTTYENLRRNSDIYTAHEWSYVVLDEAQKIRNPDADITLACKRIRTPHRLAMSGTPIQNDLRELWSLFDFVFPGRLGTLPAFEQEFAVPIKRGGYSNASPMQVQLAYRCAIMLRDLIEPFLMRRLKKDVKEVSRMPGKTEHVLFCRLSQRQRAMYEAYLQSDGVSQVLRGNNQLLAAVTMLRKIANHPDLVCDPSEASFASFVKNRGASQAALGDDSSYSNDDEVFADEESLLERSGKLEVLAKILPLWKKQGHRVLIFCQWRKMLDIVERFTRLKGWKFGRLDGNTNIASRQRLVDSFNSDESYFGMLCTTRTGGVGLNLIGANRCILYDPDWNPSGDAQARERAWRFGQEKEVTIYRLITAGTIEEKIYQRQIFKTALSNKILQDPKQRRLFSQRDLRDLFTLTADSGSVRSGADGITQTSTVTKGVGVVDGVTDLSDNNDDNEATLKKIMQSKGLAGIFDHHSVEPDHKRKSTTVREMEEQAKRVAKEAVNALKNSLSSHDPFAPTWTGSDETKPGKFGPTRVASSFRELERHPPAATLASGPISSSSLLASLRQRNSAIETGGRSEMPDEATQKYTHLLLRLKDFVRQRNPSTDEILKEFENVSDSDVANFRRLLKSVATIGNGRWSLTDTK